MNLIKRKFPPGSEWVFVKIYSGPQTLEKILIEDINDLIVTLYQRRLIVNFFFIRYQDDGTHLRIRFKVCELEKLEEVLLLLNGRFCDLLESKLLWNVTYCVYNREMERYGDKNIDDVEAVFCYSSLQVIAILSRLNELTPNVDRWLWGCYTLDLMLKKFNLSLAERFEFLDGLIKGYSNEYNLNKVSIRSLNDKYRECCKQIEDFMLKDENKLLAVPFFGDSYNIAVNRILTKSIDKTLSPPLFNLLASLVHMHLNRLFQTMQRRNEFVLCYLLNKYYKSLLARQTSVVAKK